MFVLQTGVSGLITHQPAEFAAEVMPEFFQLHQQPVAPGFALGLVTGQTLLTAPVEQQVADDTAHIKADGAEEGKLRVDHLGAGFGNENGPRVQIAVQQCFGTVEEGVFQFRHLHLEQVILPQRLGDRAQRRVDGVALVIAVRIKKEQIFGDLAQIWVDKAFYQRFFLMCIQMQITAVEQGACHEQAQMLGQLRQLTTGDQRMTQILVVAQVLHDDRGQRLVIVIHLRHPVAGMFRLQHQCFRFDAVAIQRQRPAFADDPHIGQRLLDDYTVTARFSHTVDEVDIAVTDFADLEQSIFGKQAGMAADKGDDRRIIVEFVCVHWCSFIHE